MKLKKFIAILIIAVMFASFLSVGVLLSQKGIFSGTKAPSCVNETIEVPVYINNVTSRSAAVYGVGVHEDNKTGELVEINITATPGSGRIMFDTTYHSFGTDIQDEMPVILAAVQRYTGKNFDSQDITILANAEAQTLEGTSGSSAIGVALVALQNNMTADEHIVITGTLDERGNIGAIAGLNLKLEVASEMGITRMLIPRIQCDEYDRSIDIQVTCVRTLKEAAEQMLV